MVLWTVYLDFSVTRAGCQETAVRGEGTAKHFIIMGRDLHELLT